MEYLFPKCDRRFGRTIPPKKPVEQPLEKAWYVLRVTYQRELAAKRLLDSLQVECFVPMRTVKRRINGRPVDMRESVIHNYLFVRTGKRTIDELKRFRMPYLRYVMHVQDGERQAMIVPEEQMRNFMAVAGCEREALLYFGPGEVDLAQGDRVRITGGVFEGVEGVFVRVRGARERRVVVQIDGVAAVATAAVPPQWIEKIKNP